MRDIFSRYYKQYDRWYDVATEVYLSELLAIRKFLPRKGEGLEIGVGTGRFASLLGIRYGIDPSRKMASLARKRGIDVRIARGERIPFPSGRFDYVVIVTTLCFVSSPYKVICEAARVLRDKGRIIIGIIDKDSFLGKYYERKKSKFYRDAYFLSVEDVKDLLSVCGFRKIGFYQTIFSYPHKIKSVQPPRKGYGEGGFVVVGAYKDAGLMVDKKFRQYEHIRILFKQLGYDMHLERKKVMQQAGRIKEPILDVGTGPGRMAYTLAKEGFGVTTIDISSKAQAVARLYARKYGVLSRIKFLIMDAERMKFPDGEFATVFSANLLHDVRQPRKVVEEMIRVTRKGGKLVISDLNREGRKLVNCAYRRDSKVHRSGVINFSQVVEETLKNMGVKFKKYEGSIVTTYVGLKV